MPLKAANVGSVTHDPSLFEQKKFMKSHRVSFALLCYHRTVPLDGRDALGPRRASRSAGGESSHGQPEGKRCDNCHTLSHFLLQMTETDNLTLVLKHD